MTLNESLKLMGANIWAIRVIPVKYLTKPAVYAGSNERYEYWMAPDRKTLYRLPK